MIHFIYHFIKDKKVTYTIKWRKVKQAKSYSNVNKECNLCLWEKYFIICKPDMSILNNRNDLVLGCRVTFKEISAKNCHNMINMIISFAANVT